MRAEHAWIEPDAAGPVAKETRILSGRETLLGVTRRGKEELSLLPVCRAEVFIDSLPGLFCDLEPHRSAGLLLADSHSLNGVSVRGDVFDFESDNIATAQLAIDGEIEQCQVAFALCHLKFGADRPDVFWPQWRLGSGQLALVPRGALGRSGRWISVVLHGHSPRLRERPGWSQFNGSRSPVC